MFSKAGWGVVLAALFGIVIQLLPVPDGWRAPLFVVSLVLFLAACVGWLAAHYREGQPALKAEVISLNVESTPNPDVDTDRDCFLTMSVEVSNSAADATIMDFDCTVSYRSCASEAQRIYNLGRYEQFAGYEPSDDPSDLKRKEVWEPLQEFPPDVVVVKSRPVRGMLRFHATSLPAEALRKESPTDSQFKDEVLIELFAVTGANKNRKRHLIYDEGESGGVGGRLRKRITST